MNKSLLRLLTTVLLISLISGCATPATNTTPKETQVETEISTEPTKTEVPAEPESLTLWHWETPPHRVDAYQKLFDQYKAETGVTVEQIPINFPDYQTKILAAISANNLPDMIYVNPPQLPLLISNNAIISVDELFNGLDTKHKFPEAVVTPYKVAGLQYGIPVFGVYWPLTFRKDLYEQAGLSVPETWSDLRSAAENLNIDENADGTPDVYGMCLPVSSNGNYGSQVVWAFLRSNMGDIVSVKDGKETIVFNSPENIETYEYLADLAQFSPPGKENLDWAATELLIKAGKCATVMYNAGPMSTLAQEDPDLMAKYAMALMPVPDNGGQRAHTGYPRAIVITTTGEKHMAAVQRFLDWLYTPEHHADLLNAEPGLFMPVTESTAQSQAFLSHPFINANLDKIEVQIEAGKTVSIIGYTGPEPAPHASQIESSFVLGRVLQKIVLEGMSAEDAVAWGTMQYEEIISK